MFDNVHVRGLEATYTCVQVYTSALFAKYPYVLVLALIHRPA